MSTINIPDDSRDYSTMAEEKCKKCNEEPFLLCTDNPCNYRSQLLPPLISWRYPSRNPTVDNVFDYDQVKRKETIRYACLHGNPEQVKLLLENGVDPRVLDNDEESAILWAIMGGCIHILDILIQYGCDINELKYDRGFQRNYLHFAIGRQKPKIVKYLLHLGFDPNSPFGSIHVRYCLYSDFDVLELMLSHGAKMENMTREKITLARCLMRDRTHKTTELERWFGLLIKYVGLERCDKYEYSITGLSLMHLGIMYDNIYYVDYLLKHGFDLNCRELSKNKTVLHIAASVLLDIMKPLLEYGAVTDTIDCDGNTALHLAIINRKFQDARDLLIYGARLNIVNFEGKTAVDLAIDYVNGRIIEWMLLYGAKVDEFERLAKTNYNIENYEKYIRKMLARYVIKMKILKGNQDLNVGMDVELNKLKDECMKELDIMKNSKILDEKMNCLDLLFAGKRKLVILSSKNTKNEMINFYRCVSWKLPNYRNLIWKTINEGYLHQPIYDKAFESLNNIFDSKLPILIVEDVMNYLNYQDIKNLIECFPQPL